MAIETKYWLGTTTSFSTSTNWKLADGSAAAAPGAGDTLIFNSNAAGSCTADLGSSLTGLTIIVEPSFTYSIGTVASGVPTYLHVHGGTLKMPKTSGAGSPSGSPRVLIDFGSVSAGADIDIEYTSRNPTESYLPAVQIIGTGLRANITGGVVGFAIRPGETATLDSLKIGGDSPQVTLGRGATCTSIIGNAGAIDNLSTNTTATSRFGRGCTYTNSGSGAHTTMYVESGGRAIYKGAGTIGTLYCWGSLDMSQNNNSVTITSSTFYAGHNVNIDNGVAGGVVFTNARNFPDGMGSGVFRTPAGVKSTLVAI
jgi:hypothetical protein